MDNHRSFSLAGVWRFVVAAEATTWALLGGGLSIGESIESKLTISLITREI